MRELTNSDIRVGLIIKNRKNPDWGEWSVIEKYDEGVWTIRSDHGDTTLFESEFHFWDIVR